MSGLLYVGWGIQEMRCQKRDGQKARCSRLAISLLASRVSLLRFPFLDEEPRSRQRVHTRIIPHNRLPRSMYCAGTPADDG